MDTFKDWPNESVSVEALVRAGLFYTGESSFFSLYLCGCVCLHVNMYASKACCPQRPGRVLDLGLKLQLAVSHDVLIGSKPDFFQRTVSAPG